MGTNNIFTLRRNWLFMSGNITPLSLWAQAWDLILAGAGQADHPFGLAYQANCGAEGVPRQRCVVLRQADRASASLYTYTDRRSVKAQEFRHGSLFSYLFWDAETRIQFSAHGPTFWLPADEAAQRFAKLQKHSRKAYATEHPPSTPLAEAGDGLPPDWSDRSLAQTDYAAEHFGVLVTHLQYADVLRLDRDQNLRLTATRQDNDWSLRWIVP